MTTAWLHAARVSSSIAASTLRAWRGTLVREQVEPPAQPLELFDFEACPSCRPVREALTELDLDVEVYPCPKGGTRHRPRARELAGRERFPILHDPGVGVIVCGMRRVLDHLFARFANRATPLRFRYGFASSVLATGANAARGARARPSRAASQLLELHSFEASPFARLVRERLCELELAYILRNLGKQQISDIGSSNLRLTLRRYKPKPGSKREALERLGGKVQIPYLVDPNTGSALYESRAIIEYLEQTYAR